MPTFVLSLIVFSFLSCKSSEKSQTLEAEVSPNKASVLSAATILAFEKFDFDAVLALPEDSEREIDFIGVWLKEDDTFDGRSGVFLKNGSLKWSDALTVFKPNIYHFAPDNTSSFCRPHKLGYCVILYRNIENEIRGFFTRNKSIEVKDLEFLWRKPKGSGQDTPTAR